VSRKLTAKQLRAMACYALFVNVIISLRLGGRGKNVGFSTRQPGFESQDRHIWNQQSSRCRPVCRPIV